MSPNSDAVGTDAVGTDAVGTDAVGTDAVGTDAVETDAVETAVRLPAHLHARPAGRLVQVVAPFASQVDIDYGGRVASARSILAVLALGATAGETVVVRARGADAGAAAAAAVGVLEAAE